MGIIPRSSKHQSVKQEPQTIHNAIPPHREPVVLRPELAKLESLRDAQEKISREKEAELLEINERIVALDAQIAWLKRHPEADSILRSIAEKVVG